MKKSYIKPSVEETKVQYEDILSISQNMEGNGTIYKWGDIIWEEF